MSSDFTSLRTTEEVINALSTLYFNLNEIERQFYDIFLNSTPMEVTFQRYDDQGVLQNVTIPNLASLNKNITLGSGNPNGSQSAAIGTFYMDTDTYYLYYKSSGEDTQGWVLVWSGVSLMDDSGNVTPPELFLRADGNASQLQNLNMSNAGSGLLSPEFGGTGASGIIGLVKGNGLGAMTAAVDGLDYLGPTSLAGIVAYFPISSVPFGWLQCDGRACSRATYKRLFNAIGTTYGEGDGSTTFNIPNLIDDQTLFIKCWDGHSGFNSIEESQVGSHDHPLQGDTGEESSHTHGKGSMRIQGSGIFSSTRITRKVQNGQMTDAYTNFYSGAIAMNSTNESFPDVDDDSQGTNGGRVVIDTDRGGWTGYTSGGSAHKHSLVGLRTDYNIGSQSEEVQNTVRNMMMVPVIKY